MTHALFDIYGCHLQFAAQALEIVDHGRPSGSSFLLGLTFDLGREDGMVGDLLLGYPMPDDETLTALELELHKHKLT
ncbi:uncharacterized protein RCO7_14762 [Rhynchosporium graminicola]|uniref:Uncharacterized protein n=1 Tax=Rhynchosporium graminicola TaxID=2792576 RepID=A0A1E1L0V0_9HELO|nr:uncharacterized protein RCO7_14762 [Rhynchosporium commune]